MLTSFHIQEVLMPKYKDVENSLAHAVKWTVPEKIRSQSFSNHSVQIAESIQRHTYINPIHKSNNFSSAHGKTRSSHPYYSSLFSASKIQLFSFSYFQIPFQERTWLRIPFQKIMNVLKNIITIVRSR